MRGAGSGCLRGRSCTPRGRFCCGVAGLGCLWGSSPAGGGQCCIPGAGSVVGSRSRVPPGIGLHCGGPVPLPSLGWQDAGCSGYPGGAGPGCLGWRSWQLQDPRVWLQKVGAGTAWLSPGVTSCLPGQGQGPGSWHCLVPAPSALHVPRLALQSITWGQASPQHWGLVLARLLGQAGPSKGGRVPTAAPSGLGERDPLPLMGGPGHKCTFTSHP